MTLLEQVKEALPGWWAREYTMSASKLEPARGHKINVCATHPTIQKLSAVFEPSTDTSPYCTLTYGSTHTFAVAPEGAPDYIFRLACQNMLRQQLDALASGQECIGHLLTLPQLEGHTGIEINGMFYDMPAFDTTDGAHPAWWRAHDYVAEKFKELLTSKNARIAELEKRLEEIRCLSIG